MTGPAAPEVHVHKPNGKEPCCKRPCRCAAHKAYECQACSRDRYVRLQKERGW